MSAWFQKPREGNLGGRSAMAICYLVHLFQKIKIVFQILILKARVIVPEVILV